MRVLNVRNVQEALPRAVQLIEQIGQERRSRNGLVLYGGPVTTVYEKPIERVLFHPQRDANPFFHLYESLWMLAGRNDVAPLENYVKKSIDYSDNGVTLHGAYGFRWRTHFHLDQLGHIAQILGMNPEDRRCVLQMWDTTTDLARNGKDFPCNTIATFQRGTRGELNLSVFCRSNDIVWGAYGANAVQFGALLEYMAHWIGCPIGTYEQISVNWHAYLATLKQVDKIRPDNVGFITNPYITNDVKVIPMSADRNHAAIDESISRLLNHVDSQFFPLDPGWLKGSPWSSMCYNVLRTHYIYKLYEPSEKKFRSALEALQMADYNADWVVAARQWIKRRHDTWLKVQTVPGTDPSHSAIIQE